MSWKEDISVKVGKACKGNDFNNEHTFLAKMCMQHVWWCMYGTRHVMPYVLVNTEKTWSANCQVGACGAPMRLQV